MINIKQPQGTITMQAIKTKYLPATFTKPSRIKAECEAGNLIIPYEHSLDILSNHQKAAHELIKKLGWTHIVKLHTGELKDCFVHVIESYYTDYIDMRNLPEFLKPQA